MFFSPILSMREGAQKDRLIETVLLSTYSKCFLDENQNGENGFPMHAFNWRSYFCALSRFSSFVKEP